MKVPYKINLPYKDGKIVGLIKEDGLPFLDCDGNIEYIRKDALLEWAKETYLNENASAIRKVCYKQLVEKLESR